MKFLENAKLETLSSELTLSSGDCQLETSYSCKMVQSEKRQWKKSLQPGTNPNQLQPLSPPVTDSVWPFSSSSTGRTRHLSDQFSGSDNDNDQGVTLCDSISHRTLFLLNSVLNTSFSDYDFSDLKGESFSYHANFLAVRDSVDTKFMATIRHYGSLRLALWRAIDDEIKINECRIFSYNANYITDPYCEDGCIWSFNYFFYNRNMKRVLFISCRAMRQDPSLILSAEQQWAMEDDE